MTVMPHQQFRYVFYCLDMRSAHSFVKLMDQFGLGLAAKGSFAGAPDQSEKLLLLLLLLEGTSEKE